MGKITIISILFVILLGILLYGSVWLINIRNSQPKPINYVPGELIVKFKPDVTVDIKNQTTSSDSVNALLKESQTNDISPLYNFNSPSKKGRGELDRYYIVKVPKDTDMASLQLTFRRNSGVELAAVNVIGSWK